MIQRLVAAAVGLLFLVPALLYGGLLAVQVIVGLAGWVCVAEYAAMALPKDPRAGVALGAAWSLTFAALVLAGLEGAALAGFGGVIGLLSWSTLAAGEDLSRAVDRMNRLVLGLCWLSGLGSLALLRALPDGLAWVFMVLAISWCGDTGAYFAGKSLGRHKLAPRVSPNKTWEGFFGGLVGSACGAWAVVHLAGLGLGVGEALVVGASLGALSVVGDLAESLMKRAYQVKDSGWILPGHGGILDRIDSVLFVGPLLYGYVVWGG